MDQFAYMEHCNTTMVDTKCELNWLGWLDGDVDFACHLTLVKLLILFSNESCLIIQLLV